MRILFIVIGVILFINASVLVTVSNFNWGIILLFFFSITCIMYGVFAAKIRQLTHHGVLKWVKIVILACLGCIFALSIFIAVYGKSDNATYREDAVIVLGAGIRGETPSAPLALRLDKALEYANKNKEAVIVVSGGQGYQEDITEALAMERYLIKMGLSADRIIKEEKATNTYENLSFSKEILERHFNKLFTAVIITNDFHIFRAINFSDSLGIDSTHLHAQTPWYTTLPNYLRECVSIILHFIFGL